MKTNRRQTDRQIADALRKSGVNFLSSVPCGILAGILKEITRRSKIIHVPVTREEEGVGVCAGACLGGSRPALLMQNSGLGNSLNALLSLTAFYKLPLLLVIGFRGRQEDGEKIRAQLPMGRVTERLLHLVGAKVAFIEDAADIPAIERIAKLTYEESCVGAVLLPPSLWGSGGMKD